MRLSRLLPYCLVLLTATASFAQAPTSPDWEKEIQAFEAADQTQPPAPGGILFVGSSSIRLWETLAQDFPGLPVLNRGFGGSQVADAVYFADRIILPYHPRTVVVYSGENDLAGGKTPEQVAADYRTLVRTIHRALPRTRIVLISVKPSVLRWHLLSRMRRTNRLLREFVRSDPRLRFVDVYTPMLERGRPRPELFRADLLHLNERGYALWTALVKPHL